MNRHELDGSIPVSNAEDAEAKAHEAARAYFGDQGYELAIDVEEHRTIAGDVLGYQARYTARATDDE